MKSTPHHRLSTGLVTCVAAAALATGTAAATPQPYAPTAPTPIAAGDSGSGGSGSSTGSVDDFARLGTLALCLLHLHQGPDCAWL